jgi:PDZ domain
MSILNTITKKTLLIALVAATGVPASVASAQFKVEHSAKADTPKASENKKNVWVLEDHNDQHTFMIKVINGELHLAKLDGKEIGLDQVEMKDDTVVFLSDEGDSIHEIKLHQLKHPEHKKHEDQPLHVTTDWITDSETAYVVSAQNSLYLQGEGDQDGNHIVVRSQVGAPKVMLGINLGEPSKVLRKHLNLKDGTQAILVESVIDGLPADKSGLEDFDVIISIDGSDDAHGELLKKVLSEKDAGDMMKLIVLRGGEKIKIKVKLAAYDGKALTSVSKSSYILPAGEEVIDFDFKFLDKLGEGEFGNLQGAELERIKGELHRVFTESNEQREKAYVIRAKAMDAMKDVERQIVEFRDGKLIIRANADLDRRVEHLKGRVHVAGEKLHHEAIAPHTQELDHRLAELEERLDDQMARMSDQMDRLADMFERLMDRLEDDDD